MKNYLLHRLVHPEYDWVVFSTNYERLDQYIEELLSELKSKNINNPILLDLLCSNGLNDRFYEISFEKYPIRSCEVSDSIYDYCTNWYRNHKEVLENSILSKAQKFVLTRKSEMIKYWYQTNKNGEYYENL